MFRFACGWPHKSLTRASWRFPSSAQCPPRRVPGSTTPSLIGYPTRKSSRWPLSPCKHFVPPFKLFVSCIWTHRPASTTVPWEGSSFLGRHFSCISSPNRARVIFLGLDANLRFRSRNAVTKFKLPQRVKPYSRRARSGSTLGAVSRLILSEIMRQCGPSIRRAKALQLVRNSLCSRCLSPPSECFGERLRCGRMCSATVTPVVGA